MGLEENKVIVRRFIEAVNQRDFNGLDAVVSPKVVRHSDATPMVTVHSLDDLKAMMRQDIETFPDQHVELHFLFGDDDHVAAYLTFAGTQTGPMGPFPASGKRAAVRFVGLLRLEGGKIAEIWVEWDNMSMLTQLGHLPSPES